MFTCKVRVSEKTNDSGSKLFQVVSASRAHRGGAFHEEKVQVEKGEACPPLIKMRCTGPRWWN